MRRRAILFSIAGLLMAETACDWEEFGGSGRFKRDFHETHPLKAGGKLYLENFNGAVEISGWDQDSVDISGMKYAATEELLEALKIDIVASPDSIRIRTVRPSERRGNMGAKYLLRVPRKTELDRIISSNGAIRVTDIEGNAKLRTSNGSVRTSALQGSLEAQTSNGGVQVEDLGGSALLRTSNGSVRAEQVRGAIDAVTSNGGIHVRLSKPEPHRTVKLETSNGGVELILETAGDNNVQASTSNGGITLRLPSSTEARVRAHTSNSSISTEFDVRREGRNDKHNLEGTIGSGGPTLDLSTSNGSIRVLKL